MTVRGYRRIVLTLVLLTFAQYGFADANLLVLVPGIPLVLLGWRLARDRERPLPRVLTGFLVLGAMAHAGLGVMRDGMDVSDFCQFVVLVQLIKVFDRKQARDYAQLMTLSAFLSIGAILTSAEFLPGIMLLAIVPLLIAGAMRHQFYGGLERAGELETRPSPAVGGLAGVLWLSLLTGIVVSAFVFVLMPRGVGADAFGRWTRTSAGTRTGFSDRVRLGSGGLISKSQQVVLDLSIKDGRGNPVGGPNEVFYLRGAVLDQYENGSWVRSPVEMKRMTVEPGDAMPFGRSEGEAVDLVQTITLRHVASDREYLFAAWKPVHLKFKQPCDLLYDPATRTFIRSGEAGKFQYVVQSIRQVRIPNAHFPPAQKVVAFESRPVRDLARAVLQESRIDPDGLTREQIPLAARTIENFLRTNYDYTLDLKRPTDGTDPIEWFLLEEKSGHCEYFASAMVAMCRTLGIDARVVTGYVAAEWVPESMHYVVREANAHAWVEVEVRPNIWRTYDPTPPADLIAIHKPRRNLLARIAQMIDAMEYVWIRSIVGFDEQARMRLLGGSVLDPGLSTDRRDRPEGPRLVLSPRRLVSALERGMLAFVISAVVGLGALVALHAIRRERGDDPWERLGADAAALRDQAECYQRLLEALRRLGVPKPAHTPPETHIRRVLGSDRVAHDAALRVVRAFYQLRFGHRPLTEGQQQQIARDLEILRALDRGRFGSENRGARATGS